MAQTESSSKEKTSYDEFLFSIFPDLTNAVLAGAGRPEEGVITLTFRQVLAWVKENPEASQCKLLLEKFDVPEANAQNAEFKNMIATLKEKQYYDQAFRAFCALHEGLPRDRRAWEFASHLPPSLLSSQVWSCTFLIKRIERETAGKDGFHTWVATPFERLMFLVAAKMVYSKKYEVKDSGKKVKRKYREGQDPIPSLKAVREHAHRLGYAIQVVVRAWLNFGKTLNFTSLDNMIGPYMLYDGESQTYSPIQAANEYAPKWQQERLYALEGSSDDPIKTVFDRTVEADRQLRTFAACFLKDIHDVAFMDELYSAKPAEEPAFLKTFETTRFTEFEDTPAVEELRSGVILISDSPVKRPSIQPDMVRRASRQPRKQRRLNTTVSVRESIDIDDFVSGRQAERERQDAEKRLISGMEKYVGMYACDFKELQGNALISAGKELSGQVQLVLTDPPFNHRRESGLPNSGHDEISDDDMQRCAKLIRRILLPGGHAFIFCSSMQFHKWVECLSDLKEVHEEEDDHSDTDIHMDSDTKRGPAFHVDRNHQTMTFFPGHYNGNPHMMKKGGLNVKLTAVHATKTGLPLGEMEQFVDYSNHGYVQTRHKAWTNEIDNVLRLEAGEQLRVQVSNGEGITKTVPLRPEQKSRNLLCQLICKYSQPGGLVVDLFAGTFSTAAACLKTDKHRRFVGCEKDKEAYKISKKKLVEVFAEALLDNTSDVTASDEQKADAKLVLRYAQTPRQRGEHKKWNPPSRVPGFQRLPTYFLRFLSATWKEPSFAVEYKGKPVSEWPRKWKGALAAVPAEILQAHEAAVRGLAVAKSTIRHPNAGEGLFALKAFKKHDVVAYCYGCLVYDDISKTLRAAETTTKFYGDGPAFGVTMPEFMERRVLVRLSTDFLSFKGNKFEEGRVYIVPKEWCVASKVNDPRYGEKDAEKTDVDLGDIVKRKANVEFTPTVVRSMKELTSYTTIYVRTLRDIEPGEELFADYGEDFNVDNEK